MSQTPFSDLVKDASVELAGRDLLRTAELLKYLTSQDVEQEQKRAREREAYERSLNEQYEICCEQRLREGKVPLSKSMWLSGAYEEEEGEDEMALINEDRLGTLIMERFKGRLLLALAAAAVAGFLVGILLF